MKPKDRLNLFSYGGVSVTDLNDLTLRNIIYQVYGEWNSDFTREVLEEIAYEALRDFFGN